MIRVSCDHYIIRLGLFFISEYPYFNLLCGSPLAWSLGLSWENGSAVLVSQAAEDLGLTCVNCPRVPSLRVRVLWPWIPTFLWQACQRERLGEGGSWGRGGGTPAGTDLVAVPLGVSGWETLGDFSRGFSDPLHSKQVPKLRLWPGSGKTSALRTGPQLPGAKH